MTYKLETDIHHIGKGLVACTLPKAEWTHAGHFAAAVWLLDHDIYDPFKEMPGFIPVSYTHLRAHETKANLVCRLLLEKKK